MFFVYVNIPIDCGVSYNLLGQTGILAYDLVLVEKRLWSHILQCWLQLPSHKIILLDELHFWRWGLLLPNFLLR